MRQPIILSNSGENCGQEDQLALWSSATRAGHGNFDQYKFKFKFKCQCRPKVRQGNGQPESSDEVAPGMANPRPSSKLNVVPCTGCVHGTLPELVQRALDYYVTVCHLYVFVVSVCRGCVASPKACCLSLPPSNELPRSFRVVDRGWSFFVCAV